jgi:hypothetical protein
MGDVAKKTDKVYFYIDSIHMITPTCLKNLC